MNPDCPSNDSELAAAATDQLWRKRTSRVSLGDVLAQAAASVPTKPRGQVSNRKTILGCAVRSCKETALPGPARA